MESDLTRIRGVMLKHLAEDGLDPEMETDAQSSADRVIDIKGLSLTFETADGPVHALSDIDLDIAAGDFVSFIGPSGCGKTTLLRVIADLEQATEGA